MLEFVTKAFRGFLGIILWLNLILFIIVGGIVGSFEGVTFVGIIIGVLVGLLSNIVFGGFIATIANIDKNIAEQKSLLKRLLIHSGVSEKEISEVINKSDNMKDIRQVENLNPSEKGTEGTSYIVIEPVNLRPQPNSESSVIT